MMVIVGALRLLTVIAVIVLGTFVILFCALFGLTHRGIPLANWIPVYMARIVAPAFNLRIKVADVERMRRHRGFILPNHLSFIDIVVLYAVMPLRFLSAIEVKERPILGWAAAAAGSVFVDRTNMRSRRDALKSIAHAYNAESDPPIVVFPEGRLGTGTELSRFQLGIFKLARTHRVAYLPVAIRYDNLDIAVWHGREGESLVDAAWKLATYPGPLRVTITPLDAVVPSPETSAVFMADTSHDEIAALLGFPSVAEMRAAERS